MSDIPDNCQELVDYHHVWHVNEILPLLGDRDTIVIENVADLLANMPNSDNLAQNKSFMRLVTHCRLRHVTLALLELNRTPFFSNILDVDIVT